MKIERYNFKKNEKFLKITFIDKTIYINKTIIMRMLQQLTSKTYPIGFIYKSLTPWYSYTIEKIEENKMKFSIILNGENYYFIFDESILNILLEELD